ncbi:MAG: trigger factor [Candidatus Kuenenbacteria bacterium]
MKIQINKKSQILVELTIEVEPKEYDKYLKKTAEKISRDIKIEGFRPGKAPYNIVKARVGEGEIMKEALGNIITHTFVEAIEKEKLEAIGQPEINIKKMTPGEKLIYTAVITLLPKIKLPEINSIDIKPKEIKIDEKEVDKALEHLARSRAKEIVKDGPAGGKDLVKMDYNISIAGVPQEGGQQKNFNVYLGEKHMAPGFEENIIGLKADDQKKFNVTFPKNYFQKNFAGKVSEFEVKIKGVYKLEIPDINDDFAKSLGEFKNMEELKNKIQESLKSEGQARQAKELENEMFNKLIEKTEIGELPDKMIDGEIELMISEIKSDLEMKGLQINTWLRNMGKKEEDLKKDFRSQALRRVKSALIIREVARKEKIKAKGDDIKQEIKKLEDIYHDNSELLGRLKSPEYYEYMANSLTSQKVVDWLKEKIIR